MKWCDGKLYSGGKDGQVYITDTSSMSVIKSINFGTLIRAVDCANGTIAVGTRNGNIWKCQEESEEKVCVMQSHCDGEVWGLGIAGNIVVTTADDNQIKAWDITHRVCVGTGKISDQVRRVKCGASSLSRQPASKCARGCDIAHGSGHVAVGCNDGTLTVRSAASDLDNEIFTCRDSKQWIEAVQYCPSGAKLAVGSHDNKIRIYNAEDGYSLHGTCDAHQSFITSVDWSMDASYIRSVCGAHELLFFNTSDCSQAKSGASATKGTEWANNGAKYSWSTEGIFPAAQDGSHINGVTWSKDRTLIATGDDWGLVNIFRNPARKGHHPKTLRGHSEHVVRV